MNNVRYETRTSINKKREYMKQNNDLKIKRKNKNMRLGIYRGTTEFKKGYQPRT
jgi:hypothetical protein